MEERRRGGEEERRREDEEGIPAAIHTVLGAIANVSLLPTKVFKWYPLKPMHFQGGYVIQMLKPMHTATTNEHKHYRKCQKLLKPMRLCTKDERKEETCCYSHGF